MSWARLLIGGFILAIFNPPAVALTPVRYAMTNGQTGTWTYHDDTYNGTGNPSLDATELTGGLGQLFDGIVGGDRIGTDLGNGPAYEWVGWNNVIPTITFDFDTPKALTSIAIHSNNEGNTVGLFGSVTLEFSNDGSNWTSAGAAVVRTTTTMERRDKRARFMVIPFQRTARYLRATFADGWEPWIFISEIDFNRPPDPVQLAAPQITPSANFVGSQTVTISASAGATIYYTTNGSVPVPSNGTTTAYASALTLTASRTVVRAIAVQTGALTSAMAEEEYQRIDGGTTDRWKQSTPILLANPFGVARSNVFKSIDVLPASGMRSDFGDLRFVAPNGAVLPAWPARIIPGERATFVVLVPQVPASGLTVTQYWNSANEKAAGWQPVFWTDLNGTHTDGPRLIKDRWHGSSWNADAVSLQSIPGDGGLRFHFGAVPGRDIMVGLDESNESVSYTDLSFAFYKEAGGHIIIYERGISRGDFGPFDPSLDCKITREGATVTYSIGDSVVYTSTQASSGPLHADVSIYSHPEYVESAELLGASQWVGQPEFSNFAQRTLQASAEWQPVSWLNLYGAGGTAAALTRTAPGASWNAGARSQEVIGGDGAVRFKFSPHAAGNSMIGLSSEDQDASYISIAHALHKAGSVLYVYEYGAQKVNLGSIDFSATYRVARADSEIGYFKNDELLYTSALRSSGPLFVDTSIYENGESLRDVEVSGAGGWRGIGTLAVAAPWGLTSEQGPVWTYRKFTGSSFTDLTWDGMAVWRDPTGNDAIFPQVQTNFRGFAYAHPGNANDLGAALSWTSDGNYRLRVHGFATDVDPAGTDGVTFEIRRGTTLLDRRYIREGTETPLDLVTQVNAGETLSFITHRNRSYYNDGTVFLPLIELLEEISPTVSQPKISPSGGIYNDQVSITLATATSGAILRYTLDGTEPTETTGILYPAGASILLSEATVVRARAFKAGMTASEVTRGEFAVTASSTPGLAREVWLGLPGRTITDLKESAIFPGEPSSRGYLTAAIAPENSADDYGTRLRGYVLPPQTGEYLFWVAADSASELYLSPDDDPAHKTLIAYNGTAVPPNSWTTTRTQQSQPVRLVAGRRYYLEALHKAGAGSDHLSIGWQLPDGTLERPIPGERLRPYGENDRATFLPPPVITPFGGSYHLGESIRVTIDPLTSGADVRYSVDGSDLAAATDGLAHDPNSPITISETKTLKVRVFKSGLLTSAQVSAQYVFTAPPPGIRGSNLRLWLRADAGIESVTSTFGTLRVAGWRDQSGQHFDAQQADRLRQPVVVPDALNGKPVIRFDGVDDGLLVDAALNVGRPSTVFIVYRVLETNTGRLIQSASGSNWLLGTHFNNHGYHADAWVKSDAPIEANRSYVSVAVQNSTSSRYYLNGEDLTTNPSPVGLLGRIALGGAVGTHHQPAYVDLAEVIVYDRVLSDSDRQEVEAYLANRYSLFLPQVAAPVISPASGHYDTAQQVYLTTTTNGASIRYTVNGSDPVSATDGLQYSSGTPIPITATTTIKARAFRANFEPSALARAEFEIGSERLPVASDHRVVWWRADGPMTADSQGRVSRWSDDSTRGSDLVQPESALQPVVTANALNGKPVLHFETGAQGLRPGSTLNLRRPSTVFAVYRRGPGSTGNRLLQSTTSNWLLGLHFSIHGYHADGWVSPITLNPEDNRPWVATAVQRSDLSEFFLNGANQTSNPHFIGNVGALAVNGGGQFAGLNNVDLAEVIAYDIALTPSDRRAVETYLASKYALPLAVAPVEISPFGGAYNAAAPPITLSCATSGAAIRYTRDGTEPTESSTLYTAPLVLTELQTTLKARAFLSGSPASGTTSAVFLVAPSSGADAAGALVERYSIGFNPGGIAGMRQLSWFPDRSSSRFYTNSWSDRMDSEDYYGTIIRGYFHAPETGDYRFGSTSDDDGEFWISTDDDPAHIVRVSSSACCSPWTSYLSEPIRLVAGRRYYIESRHIEYAGGAYIQAGVRLPDGRDVFPLSATYDFDGNSGNNAEFVLLRPYGKSDSPSKVASPVLTPAGGVFAASAVVAITSASSGATIHYTLDGTDPTEASSVYAGPLTLTATATVKARAYLANFEPSEVVSQSFIRDGTTAFTRSGLRLWLRADQGVTTTGTQVSQWLDLSGSGRHARQASAADQPLLQPSVAAFNHRATVKFDGISDHLLLPGISAAKFTAFMVFQQTAGGGARSGPFNNRVSGQPGFQIVNDLDAPSSYTPHLAITNGDAELSNVRAAMAVPVPFAAPSLQVWSSNFSFVRDGRDEIGTLSASGNYGPSYDQAILGRGAQPWAGEIAEFLVFDRELLAAERDAVEAYLADRNGITRSVASPQASPGGGMYGEATTVTLTTPTPGATLRYTVNGSDLATAADGLPYQGPLSISSTTTVKARAFKAGLTPSVQLSVDYRIDPAIGAVPRAGLQLWLRGDAGVETSGGAVARWLDQSGLGRHADQTVAGNRPTIAATGVGGRLAISFSGASQFLRLPAGFRDFSQGLTAIVIARPSASNSGARFFDLGVGPGTQNILLARNGTSTTLTYEVYGAGVSKGQVNIGDGLFNGSKHIISVVQLPTGKATVYQNGVEQGSGSIGLPANVARTSNLIGASNWAEGGYFQGEIAEILLYNLALEPTARTALEDYLRGRYGIATSTVATPAIVPPGGFQSGSVSVQLSTSTADALIRYTLDGSDPELTNPGARIYAGAFTLTATTTVKAKGFKSGFNDSPTATARFTVGDAPSAGDGLAAVYFDQENFTGTTVRRRDAGIDFDFGAGSPDGAIAPDTFSARWTGELQPQFSEAFTFHLGSDDGARFWLDVNRNGSFEEEERLIDDWSPHGYREATSAAVTLTRGLRYSIKIEHHEGADVAALRLFWSSASVAKSLVPQSQLFSGLMFPVTVRTPVPTPRGGAFANAASVSLVTPTSDAVVYYTLDGSVPSSTNGRRYNGTPFSIVSTQTLKAIAVRSSANDSGIYEGVFEIDSSGPAISEIRYAGAALGDGAVVRRPDRFSAVVADGAGVSRVLFILRSASGTESNLGTDTVGGDGYSVPWAAATQPDGAYTLIVRAYDTFNTLSERQVPFSLQLAPPPPPEITTPVDGYTTNRPLVSVSGRAASDATVYLRLNGTRIDLPLSVDATGNFSSTINLASGSTVLTAIARNRGGDSEPSPAVNLTLDASVPPPPVGLTASSRVGGGIRLEWSPPIGTTVKGYHVYRSTSSFSTSPPATRLTTTPISAQSFEDLPATDGRYFYRVTTVNGPGTESGWSAEASAASDRTLPKGAAITFTHRDPTKVKGGRFGRGLVDTVLEVSEPLAAIPFLSLSPQGGGFPIVVALTQETPLRYTGTFTLTGSTPSGLATVNFSARDVAGNRGTSVDAGSTLMIDTRGPLATALAVTPGSPIKASSGSAPTEVTVRLTIDEMPQLLPSPQVQLSWRLSALASHQTPTTIALTAAEDAQTWTGTFTLPAGAGAPSPEELSFTYSAVDDLGNNHDRFASGVVTKFQVYQGSLPTLESPHQFTAVARAGGRVALAWIRVQDASGYRLYRSAPGGLVSVTTIDISNPDTLTYDDRPGSDGTYRYWIGTLRSANGQTVAGEMSPPAVVKVDSVPPGKPAGLTAQLVGNGIGLSWTPLTGQTEPFTYRLYRGVPNPLTSVSGAQLLASDLSAVSVVDPHPSLTEHSYVVTAVDAAGNESPVSNSVYLNPTLYPVSSLTIVRRGASAPLISWTNPTPAIKGFDLLAGPTASAVKLNDTLLTSLSFTDAGYPGGDRFYSVVTYDPAGIASPARTLLLPAVTHALKPAQVVKRGVMNRVEFSVKNSSVAGIFRARLRVAFGGVEHFSQPFTLDAGAETDVGVVLGGYPGLTGATAPLTSTLEIAPNEGEKVSLIQSDTIGLAEGGLILQVLPGEFAAGGFGRARFKLNNTSDEQIELITASDQGRAPSPDLHFTLLDAEGHALTIFDYQETLGTGQEVVPANPLAGLITVPNGITVLRIPGRTEYTSPEFLLEVPPTTATQLTLKFEMGQVYSRFGEPEQVTLPGTSARAAVSLAETSYRGEITAVTPDLSTGDRPIVIAGRAVSRAGGTAMPGAALRMGIIVNGFERVVNLLTGADGTFTYSFVPQGGESGFYSIWITHPDLTAKVVQRTFVISRVTVTPGTQAVTVPQNYQQAVPFTVQPGLGTSVTNLRLVPLTPSPAGITVTLPPVVSVAPGQSTRLSVGFIGDTSAATTGSLRYKVISDENPTDGWSVVTINYTLTEAFANLTTTPRLIDTGVSPGGSASETVILRSNGLVAAQNLRFNLAQTDGSWTGTPLPAPSWIGLGGSGVASLEVGRELPLAINFTPPSSLAEGEYFFLLRISSDNVAPFDVGIHVTVTTSETGNVTFKVVDFYTNFGAPATNPDFYGLRNASLTLQRETDPPVIRTEITDALGEVEVKDLPVGRYKYRVTAPGHDSVIGRFTIRPGVTVAETALLNNRFVTVEWEVVPITIQDRYEIVLNTTFETNVPAAVLVVDPPLINLPAMCEGDVHQSELRITNHGLVRADDVELVAPPSDDYFRYEFLGNVPSVVEAGESLIVPYRIVALKAMPGNCPNVNPNAANECFAYTRCFTVRWNTRCFFGLLAGGSANVCFSYRFGACGGASGSTRPTGPGEPGPGGPGDPGSGSVGPIFTGPSGPGGFPTWSPVSEAVSGTWCKAKCDKAKDPCCDQDTTAPTGSDVDLVSGIYSDGVSDLKVNVPGETIDVARSYRDGIWQFERIREPVKMVRDSLGVLTSIERLLEKFPRIGESFLKIGSNSERFVPLQNGANLVVGYRYEHRATKHWEEYDLDGHPTAFGLGFDGERRVQARLIYRTGTHVLTEVRNHLDQVALKFGYDPADRVTRVDGQGGAYVTYTYSAAGNLETVRDLRGNLTTYTYNAQNLLLRKQLPGGKEYKVTYHPTFGYVTSVMNERDRGYTFEFSQDAARKQSYCRMTHSSGRVEEHYFDAAKNLIRLDVNGRTVKKVLSTEDGTVTIDAWGHQTTTQASDGGRVYVVTAPDGSVSRREYSNGLLAKRVDGAGAQITYEYDSEGRIIRTTEGAGTANAKVTELAYDAAGRIHTRTIKGAEPLLDAVTTYEYDNYGRPIVVVDPEGGTRRFIYNDLNQLTDRYDGEGHHFGYTYDLLTGRVATLFNELGHTIRYTFDSLGRPKTLTDALDHTQTLEYRVDRVVLTNFAGHQSVKEFDLDGRPRRTIDEVGNVKSVEYDAFDRITKVTDGSGNVMTMEYDAAGAGVLRGGDDRITRIVGPTFTQEAEYDAGGRIVKHTLVDGAHRVAVEVGTFDGAGRMRSIKDRLGYETTYEYDALGHRTKQSFAMGDRQKTTEWTFDPQGNVTRLKDALGHEAKVTYDRKGRPVRKELPDGLVSTFRYDRNDRMIEAIDPAGHKIEMEYDAAGRAVTQRVFAQRTDSAPRKVIRFTYDAVNRLREWDDSTASATLTYDEMGRKLTETVNYGNGVVLGHRYTYYANGAKRTYTGPDGVTYTFTYDSENQVKTVSAPDLGVITVSDYTWTGAKTTILPGGIVRRLAYDGLMQITGVRYERPDGSLIFTETTARDAAGNVTARVGTDGDFGYGYDQDGQLLDFTSTNSSIPAEAFSYDLVGNRKGATGITAIDYGLGNRLDRYGAETFIYDANGSIVRRVNPNSGDTSDYSYDEQGRMTALLRNGATIATYGYDIRGRRLWKDVGGAKTYFHYSDEGLVAEVDAGGALVRSYGRNPRSRAGVDPMFLRTGAGQYYFYACDHLGTPRALFTSTGVVTWSAAYTPFGRAVVATSSVVVNPLRESNQYYDRESGLHYNEQRFYDPELGRYLRKDPIGFAGGINLYAYVQNNPARWIDPTGEKPESPGSCFSVKKEFQIAETGGKIGPFESTLSAKGELTYNLCSKCCSNGASKGGLSREDQLCFKLSGEWEAEYTSFDINLLLVSIQAGLRASGKIGISGSGCVTSGGCDGKSRCTEIEVEVEGSLFVGVVIEVSGQGPLSVFSFEAAAGGELGVSGKLTLELCPGPTFSVVNTEVCTSGEIYANIKISAASSLDTSYDFNSREWRHTFWKGENCRP